MRRIYLHLPGVVWGEILIYGFFFGVGDGVGVGGASVDGAAAISPSFAPAASTSFVVISSLVKGPIATTLQTRWISLSDAKGAFNQTSLVIAVIIKATLGCSWAGSVSNSNPRFCIALCDLMRLLPPTWSEISMGRRIPVGPGAVLVAVERSSVGITISWACSSISLTLNPKDASS